VAVEAFAAEGLSVPVQEIARRAGVGTGTVSRHFPAKESLFEAILLIKARQLIDEAARLASSADPGDAFFARIVAEGPENRGMAEALTSAGFDFDAAALREGLDVIGTLGDLLAGAARRSRPWRCRYRRREGPHHRLSGQDVGHRRPCRPRPDHPDRLPGPARRITRAMTVRA
jgi:AcrR family transcriptional regulator